VDASLGGHTGTSAGNTYLPFQAVPQLVLPYAYGPIFAFGDSKLTLTGIWSHVGGFLPTTLVMLALIGVMSRGRRGLRLALLAWIVVSLARIYGEPRLLSDAVGLLPGMSHVAFYRYGFPSVELAVTILAAIGLEELARASVSHRRLAALTSIVLVAVALAALGGRPLAPPLRG